jgi:uncharacterized protein YkwD
MKGLRIKILICMLAFIGTSFGQLSSEQGVALNKEVLKHINSLRKSLNVPDLADNDTLSKAAEFHSDYMVKQQDLTHDERSELTKTPTLRVKKFKGKNFESVGENVLYTRSIELPLKKKDLELIALEMFTSWKESPGHYANMIDPEYTHSGLGFAYDPKKRVIYATNVLARKGCEIPNQLSENAFAVKEEIPNCDESFKGFMNLVLNMGNGIEIKENEVLLYHHNVNYIERIFKNENDGLAVDLVSRDQFQCGLPNRLDASAIYDGVLLEPIYKKEILENNTAKSDFRYIGKIGEIPDELVGLPFQPSLILIKEGRKCKYMIPVYVPSSPYELQAVEPELVNPKNIVLLKEGIVAVDLIPYEFKTNVITPIKKADLSKRELEIEAVQIKTYSSVEGDSTHNSYLHEARAESILKELQNSLSLNDGQSQIDAKENWELMDFQLLYFQKDDLKALSHDSLKRLIASGDQTLNWDSLLFQQRVSHALIYYKGKLEPESSVDDLIEMNLLTALIQGKTDLANKALYEHFQADTTDGSFYFEPSIYNYALTQPELVQNFTANLTRFYDLDFAKSTRFLFNWFQKREQLSDGAKRNLLQLYCLLGTSLMKDWDLESKRLSNVIHPSRIKAFSGNVKQAELLLNLHLTFIQYFGQINDGDNINVSFNFISDYFKDKALAPEAVVDLALFYNSWSMYAMTIDYLSPLFEKNNLNEDGVFVLAHTLSFLAFEESDPFYESVLLKAAEINPERFCNWLYQDFQLLRAYKVKRTYCEICESY